LFPSDKAFSMSLVAGSDSTEGGRAGFAFELAVGVVRAGAFGGVAGAVVGTTVVIVAGTFRGTVGFVTGTLGGTTVGIVAGTFRGTVGFVIGALVGTTVGLAAGAFRGGTPGFVAGSFVLTSAGLVPGVVDGATLGFVPGAVVGATVGAVVGALRGATVGWTIGVAVDTGPLFGSEMSGRFGPVVILSVVPREPATIVPATNAHRTMTVPTMNAGFFRPWERGVVGGTSGG
jgi:hypothetical protein